MREKGPRIIRFVPGRGENPIPPRVINHAAKPVTEPPVTRSPFSHVQEIMEFHLRKFRHGKRKP